jgi:hypothetical protein
MATMPLDSPMPPASQHLRALKRANVVRLAATDVKREIARGKLSLADALDDDRAGVLMVMDLLMAQRKWGRDRAVRLLNAMAAEDPANRLSETKRVRELTTRQKSILASWCEP